MKVDMNTKGGRALRRLLGEKRGAVAMEYIVIALLIGAAVVALVMVFGENLRNMMGATNRTITSSSTTEVSTRANDYKEQRDKSEAEVKKAQTTGKTLGGDAGITKSE